MAINWKKKIMKIRGDFILYLGIRFRLPGIYEAKERGRNKFAILTVEAPVWQGAKA